MRIIIFLFFLLCSSSLFAATPLTYAKCKRNTNTWSVTEDIDIGGSSQSITKDFRLDQFSVTYDVKRLLSNEYTINEFTGLCNLVHRDASGVETTIFSCEGRPHSGDQACAALMPKVSPDGNKIAFTVYWGNNLPYQVAPVNYDFAANADNGGGQVYPANGNGGYVEICSAYAANGYSCASENDVLVHRLLAKWAQLYEYDIAQDTVTEVTSKVVGQFDISPTYLSNTRLGFVTTRDMGRTPMITVHQLSEEALGWATIDADGRNYRNISKHRLTREFEGSVTPSGDILFTMQLMSAGFPYVCNNGEPGNSCTSYNITSQWFMNEWGERGAAIGQHTAGATPDSNGLIFLSLRPLTFTVDVNDDITVWSPTYYRGNSNSLGGLIATALPDAFKEGPNGFQVSNHADAFLPTPRWNAATFADSEDQNSNVDVAFNGKFLGKLGYPGTLPGEKLVVTWGKGPCTVTIVPDEIYPLIGLTLSNSATQGSSGLAYGAELDEIQAHIGETVPACDMNLYELTPPSITSPNDLVTLVEDPEYNLIGAQAVVPYSTLYPGYTAPAIKPRPDTVANDSRLLFGTTDAFFGSGSIRDRDTKPCDTDDWDNHRNYHACGTETAVVSDDDIVGIRFLRAKPNITGVNTTNMNNAFGYDIEILGEFRIDNRDGSNDPIMEPAPHQANRDTSFLARLPADVPLIIQAIDKDGLAVSTDQTPFSLFPGSKVTCGGCHKHSDDPRITFDQSHAATPGYTPFDLTVNSTTLLAGESGGVQQYDNIASRTVQIEYESDIKPIFDAHCISCHNTANASDAPTCQATSGCLDLSVSNPADPWQPGMTLHTLVGDGFGKINRPQLSDNVKMLNARESRLYWKAAGQRTDGRTDGDRPDDIDFGVAHTTSITPAELRTLARWIDTGSSGGTNATDDRLPPVLVLNSVINGADTTDIVIGTHDSDVSTFELCRITPPSTTCVDENPPSINADGITTINLSSPISNDDVEFRATIQDAAGNTTTEQFTIGHMAQFASGFSPPADINVNAGNTASVFEGDTVYKQIKLPPGTGRSYSVNWGDGSQDSTGSIADGAKSFEISKTFPDGFNIYTATVTVNGSNESGNDDFNIIVANKNPTGTVAAPSTVNLYEDITLVVTHSDDGDDTLVNYDIAWGDGSNSSDTTHAYTIAGNYTIEVYAIDEDGKYLIATHIVMVNNAPPPCE